MSRPYKNRPFPITLFEWDKTRARHFFCFWFLCNEFDSDEEGWIRVSRKEFNKIANLHIPVPVHNPTLILESLQEMDYIEFIRSKRETGWRDCTTDYYAIRISPNAWDVNHHVMNKRYLQNPDKVEDLKAFYKARYAKQKAKRLAEQEL